MNLRNIYVLTLSLPIIIIIKDKIMCTDQMTTDRIQIMAQQEVNGDTDF